MKISDMLIMCLRNLWRRKGRTMLTVVGVVIGSCAVIVMISLGLGMSEAMDGMLASWGDLTAVTIYNYNTSSADKDRVKVTDDIVKYFEGLDHVSYVIPRLQLSSEMLTIVTGKNDRYRLNGEVVGVDFSLLDKMGYEIDEGKFPEPEDYNSTIIFGYEMPYQFTDTKKRGNASMTYRMTLPDGSFSEPFVKPVGERIKLAVNNTKKPNSDGTYSYGGKGYETYVTGAAVLKTDNNWETPYAVMINIDLAKQIINDYNRLNGVKNAKELEYSTVKISADDLNNVDGIQKAVEDLGLRASSMAQVRNEMQGQLGTIELVLGCLAGISLVVAAISITNTMIMSIYERTREIGIMKVLGCYIGNIRMIFLMEAGLIGLLGGIIGTLISYGISFAMNNLMESGISQMMGIYTEGGGSVSIIPIWLVLLALVFSTVIGLVSGFYPANRAVKISALEAIKNE